MPRAAHAGAVAAALLSLLLLISPAHAHVQAVRGRLVEVVGQSELVIIGTVEQLTPVGKRHADATVRVEAVLAGQTTTNALTFRTPTGLAPHARYAFFLRRVDQGLTSVAPSGAVFPARREDDASYRTAVTAVAAALRAGASTRTTELRSALLGTLSASAPALRYYAALDLAALAHAGPPLAASERATLERLVADPATDADLRPLLTGLLQQRYP
jgi:hypothetical protein